MDIKKILALTVIVLALFSCMNVASAGWFDFLFGPGEVANQTYTFDGFTLDIPQNANVTKNTTSENGYNITEYKINWTTGEKNANVTNIGVAVAKGDYIVNSTDEYIKNCVNMGAKSIGNYSNWTIIDLNGVPVPMFANWNINVTYTGYNLAQHTGSQLITISGEDLPLLENVANTYKKA